MDFRTQIENAKRDTKKTSFKLYAQLAAEDVKERLLDVAGHFAKGESFEYAGYICPSSTYSLFHKKEIEQGERIITKFWLDDDFDIFFQTLRSDLEKNNTQISVCKPRLIPNLCLGNDCYTKHTLSNYNSCTFEFIDDFSRISIKKLNKFFDFPVSTQYFLSNPSLIIPFIYDF